MLTSPGVLPDPAPASRPRAFIDLHCHTNGSFDCLSDPRSVVRAAAARGLTHLAITDHERVDAARRARDAAPPELTVIVGEEIRSRDGDLIALFLERAVPAGLPALETIALVREQGGLVGVPHPFDRFRGTVSRRNALAGIVPAVDWIEVHNARLVGGGNLRAIEFAREHGLPGVGVSDAHSILEVGVAYSVMDGDPSTPAGLLEALASVRPVGGRASYLVRTLTPVAKVVQRLRGQGRVRPSAAVRT